LSEREQRILLGHLHRERRVSCDLERQLDAALALLDRKKFVVGIKSKFKGVMWNISDAGEAARLEMR